MSGRVPPGAVIELGAAAHLVYIQFVERVPQYGALVRALPGTYRVRPDAVELAARPELFSVFFPLHAALRRDVVRMVATAPLPRGWKRPVMRLPGWLPGASAHGPRSWWLWDGVREWKVSEGDPAVRDASPREVWNDLMIIDRIAAGWTPGAGLETS